MVHHPSPGHDAGRVRRLIDRIHRRRDDRAAGRLVAQALTDLAVADTSDERRWALQALGRAERLRGAPVAAGLADMIATTERPVAADTVLDDSADVAEIVSRLRHAGGVISRAHLVLALGEVYGPALREEAVHPTVLRDVAVALQRSAGYSDRQIDADLRSPR